GIGGLADAVAAALAPGTIMLSTPISDLRRSSHYQLSSPAGTIEGRAVVLAVPAYVAAGLLRAFDTTLAGLCDAVPYASTGTVAFGYSRDQIAHPMRGSGF